MTTVELRTSIAAELDQMSVEMLESVSRYVSRLRRRARPSRRVSSVQDRREAAMLFVKNLSVQGGLPVPSDESGIDEQADCIVTRNKKDFKASTLPVLTPLEFFNRIDSK